VRKSPETGAASPRGALPQVVVCEQVMAASALSRLFPFCACSPMFKRLDCGSLGEEEGHAGEAIRRCVRRGRDGGNNTPSYSHSQKGTSIIRSSPRALLNISTLSLPPRLGLFNEQPLPFLRIPRGCGSGRIRASGWIFPRVTRVRPVRATRLTCCRDSRTYDSWPTRRIFAGTGR
jgi:hypothetical protein